MGTDQRCDDAGADRSPSSDPRPRDGHEPIIEMRLGPTRYTFTAKAAAATRGLQHRPVLARMLEKRLRAYRAMGYEAEDVEDGTAGRKPVVEYEESDGQAQVGK